MPQTIKQIKSRIISINNTKKLTNAMELISRTKYQTSFKKLSYSREYLLNIEDFLSRILVDSSFMKYFENFDTKKMILIIFSSDNGFCSNYNIEILKAVKSFLKDEKENVEIYLIGKKLFNNLSNLGLSCKKLYTGYLGRYSRDIISDLVNILIESKNKNIYAIYTNFHSSVKQNVIVDFIFSKFFNSFDFELKNFSKINNSKDLKNEDIERNENFDKLNYKILDNFKNKNLKFSELNVNDEYIKELKFDDEFFCKIIRLFLFAKLKNIFLESIVSEHANRMLSMRTANDNAKHILEKLVLSLNKTRQALITGELIEIISSSDAIKNS